jgi:hypothetical protein
MKYYLTLFILCFLIISCNKNEKKNSSKESKNNVSKLAVNDPFSNTTIESEFFNISADEDTIIEGKNGTIIQIPKGAFKDAQGNVITGNVKIDLAEPETLDDYLLSGISSQSGDKLLDSRGTFYINASQNGKQLFLNEDKPIYIEKPLKGKKEGDLSIFSGEKREDGQIEWSESTIIEKFLIPVDLELLDFLPEGFEKEVQKGMPFRSYTSATKNLIDSLYYSMEYEATIAPITNEVAIIEISDSVYELLDALADDTETIDSVETPCGIRPADIKAIYSKKFNNTL